MEEKNMPHRKGFYEKYVKRPLDIVLSFTALIVLSPLMLVLAFLVRIKLGSPVIFHQKRPGLNEKIFTLHKFRTMTDARDAEGKLLPDEQRLTKFGKWLRSTSLDELPELWNILVGDMSVVGPRPLTIQYLNRYNEYHKRRHEVMVGLTGYAQVHGRNASSWKDRLDNDVYYVDHISFKIDLWVILKTVQVIFKREGITSKTSVTMDEFMGD